MNEEAQVSGAVVVATELRGGGGKISILECTGEVCTVKGASQGSRGDRTGEIDRAGEAVIGERSEAVQTAGPIDGDARRTSVAEGNVGEGEALDMT